MRCSRDLVALSCSIIVAVFAVPSHSRLFHFEASAPSLIWSSYGNYNGLQLENETTTTTERSIPQNATLDTTTDIIPTFWLIARGFKHYLEYYNDIVQFRNKSHDVGSCSYYMADKDRDILSETDGIWVACQDQEMPSLCLTTPSQPCYPFITYDSKATANPRLRTIKVKFAVKGLAVLRLKVNDKCFDYSLRKDPFSVCEYIIVKEGSASDEIGYANGWHKLLFSFFPDLNNPFRSFTFELIARFQHDVVLVDKIESTDYLLCDQDDTPCPTLPTTPFPTFTSPTTTPTTTTTDSIITDDDSDPTTWTTKPPEESTGTSSPPSSSPSQYPSALSIILTHFVLSCFQLYRY